MKHLLFTFFLICSLQGFGQISISHESGVVVPGTHISVSNEGNTPMYLSWDQYRPGRLHYDLVIPSNTTQVVLVPALDTTPVFSNVNTMINPESPLASGLPVGFTSTDSVFQLLTSVAKHNTLWITREACDSCDIIRHYLAEPVDSGYKVFITMEPYEALSDSVGIMVAGEGNILPWGMFGLTVNPDQTFHFPDFGSPYPSTMLTVTVDTTGSVYNGIHQTYTWPQGSLVYLGGSLINLEYLEINLLDSTIMAIEVGVPDTFLGSLNNFNLIDSFYQFGLLEDGGTLPIPDPVIPNFNTSASWNWLDLYPEINRGIVWKKVFITIFHDYQLVYGGWGEMRVTGNWSTYHPKKSMRIRLDNKWTYPDLSEYPIDILNMRAFGSGKDNHMLSNKIANDLFYGDSLSVGGGQVAEYYLFGEYHGITVIGEHLGEDFISDRFDVKKKNIEMSHRTDDLITGIMILDAHRDSVAPRQIEYTEFMDWLESADKNSAGFIDSLLDMLDIRAMFKSFIASAYVARADNNLHNARTWKTDKLPYREMIKDFDYSFFCGAVTENSLEMQLFSDTSNRWTVNVDIFQELMESDTLSWMFINTMADMINTTLSVENMVAAISRAYNQAKPYIGQNHDRWKHHIYNIEPDSLGVYQEVQCMLDFAQQREAYVLEDMDELFEVGTTTVEFRVHGANHQQLLKVNQMTTTDPIGVSRLSFTGTPTRIYADPFGLEYITVNNDTLFQNDFYMEFDSGVVYDIVAYYNVILDPYIDSISLQEVVADNESVITDEEGKFEDYIEIINRSDTAVNLAGASMSDGTNIHIFKQDLWIGSGERMLLFADRDTEDGVHHLNFKIDKDGGEVISLLNGNDTIDAMPATPIPKDVANAYCDSGSWVLQVPTPVMENDCNPILLPIDLISFEIHVNQQEGYLKPMWSIVGQPSVQLMGSLDGQNFEQIYSGFGESFIDMDVTPSKRKYYQLFWGNNFSPVKSGAIISTGLQDLDLVLLPNPNNGNIIIPKGYQIEFINTLGQVVAQGVSGELVQLPRGVVLCVFYEDKTQSFLGSKKFLVK